MAAAWNASVRAPGKVVKKDLFVRYVPEQEKYFKGGIFEIMFPS